METLSLLSGLIAAHITHATDYQEREHASMHDALTGLPNRRSFDERLATGAARLRRRGGEATVCLIDLDRFKEVNDSQGHAVGDEVLRSVSWHLGESRGEDGAFRVGGDEFALLLADSPPSAARDVADRVAQAIREDPFCRGVEASYGIASLGAGDPLGSVARADEALYAAKRARRR